MIPLLDVVVGAFPLLRCREGEDETGREQGRRNWPGQRGVGRAAGRRRGTGRGAESARPQSCPREPRLMALLSMGPFRDLGPFPNPQGAEAYAPGVAAAPAAYGPGMRCNLYGDAVDMFKSRGVTAEPEECLRDHASGRLVFLGLAETLQSRAETFGGAQRGARQIVPARSRGRSPFACSGAPWSLLMSLMPLSWRCPSAGQTLAFLQRVHDLPPLNNILPDLVTLQGLPSSLAAHALDPQPGETILDMCSSPGGKACHVASLMKNTGGTVPWRETTPPSPSPRGSGGRCKQQRPVDDGPLTASGPGSCRLRGSGGQDRDKGRQDRAALKAARADKRQGGGG